MPTIIATVAALYLGYATFMFVRQRALLFPGATVKRVFAANWPEEVQLVTLPASFGHVSSLFLPARQPPKRAPALVFMHGNSQFVDELVPAFDTVRALGLHVLLLEYPGYGGMPGAPTFASMREASSVAYDWLAQHPNVDASRIVAMGASIGGGPAAQLSADRPLKALVLLSTFVELAQFARERWLPGAIVRDRFHNAARVREFDGPVMVVHGRRDDVIPFASGEYLARSARRGCFVPLDCGHEIAEHVTPALMQAFERFLREAGVLRTRRRPHRALRLRRSLRAPGLRLAAAAG
ncbi:MAG TPA: prolyl oligopeptidase family serine peptidase [Xanthomonadales bacterium]|nr:prolyl oligopeptidase family serine peptidase [Xanthomonadales bacterium]